MGAFRNNSVLTSGRIIRVMFILIGLACIGFALEFVVRLPDTMPGPAMGALGMLILGAILVLGGLWIGL
ncbi:hypothetical protein LOC54_01960 [Acetobacter sp. AN02]|uniref:hypothetical protein n=1 Tax=Acetobacter sp. AN02 TaxID=2894186 RepID=UPI0024342748|nr:hypothetical protein [Acetobacter sp. AN02]MDG6093886.1 hypothetical protein [Acetobacter sp. AN02]